MTTAPKFVPDNNTPAAAPPEVPQWSEPMRYDVPQSNGCAGCPRLFVGTKWVGEICGAVYLGHNSVKYAERIVALWNDDIARHAPQPEAQPATLRTRAEAAEAKCAEYRDTFTAANEMRLSGVRLRQAVQQRAELAEMRCTEALDRLEVANQQLAELLAANERMRAAMNDIDAYVRDIRHGATFADSMRDTIIITIRQALAAAETGVAK